MKIRLVWLVLGLCLLGNIVHSRWAAPEAGAEEWQVSSEHYRIYDEYSSPPCRRCRRAYPYSGFQFMRTDFGTGFSNRRKSRGFELQWYGSECPVADQLAELDQPRGGDYPECNEWCLPVKARLAFAYTLYQIEPRISTDWYYPAVPRGLMPRYGGHYWQYAAAVEACKKHLRKCANRAIQNDGQNIASWTKMLGEYWERYELDPSGYYLKTINELTTLIRERETARQQRQKLLKMELAEWDKTLDRIRDLLTQIGERVVAEGIWSADGPLMRGSMWATWLTKGEI